MRNLEYPFLSDGTFKDLTDLFFSETGVTLKNNKKYLVVHRLSRFVGPDKPYPTFESYYTAIKNDKTKDLLTGLVNSLTTNFSYFFRENVHFNFLKKYLIENMAKEQYIRLWSAACSTGEEAYSMAITCLHTLQNIKSLDLKILATDVSTNVLNKAKEGIYHHSRIKNQVNDMDLRSFFKFNMESKSFIVNRDVRDLVAFRYLNLFDPYPFKKLFDVIFLRNVLIYFDHREKQSIINKIFDYLKPNGYLIIGLSETLIGIDSPYKSLSNSIYRKI